jgi:RNA polymerase sigma-70 factor (ECF subfamily)
MGAGIFVSEEDLALLRGNIHGLDGVAQRRLFMTFRQCVYRDIFYLLGDHALTEDVIQEAFLKAVQKGPNTRPDSNMTAWLRKISRNTAYDFLRKNKKNRQMIDLDLVNHMEHTETLEQSAASVEDIVENMIRNELLLEAIRNLKPDYRIVLLLHYMIGMTYSEIVQELEISEQVLTQRLARARKKLALCFIEKWGVPDESK